MRPSFAKRTITRLRYPISSDQGVESIDTDASPDESPIQGCWYEPTTSSVIKDGRLAVRTGYTVDAPRDTFLDARRDHVRIDGVEFELDGEPLSVPSPTGALDSTRFVCVRWEG